MIDQFKSLTSKPVETRPIKPDRTKTPPTCVVCFEEAAIEALFELENALIIQRYCDKCISRAEY